MRIHEVLSPSGFCSFECYTLDSERLLSGDIPRNWQRSARYHVESSFKCSCRDLSTLERLRRAGTSRQDVMLASDSPGTPRRGVPRSDTQRADVRVGQKDTIATFYVAGLVCGRWGRKRQHYWKCCKAGNAFTTIASGHPRHRH